MPTFIEVPTTDRDGQHNVEFVNIEGISRLKTINGKTVIVMRDANNYDIWSTASVMVIRQAIIDSGASIIALDKAPPRPTPKRQRKHQHPPATKSTIPGRNRGAEYDQPVFEKDDEIPF